MVLDCKIKTNHFKEERQTRANILEELKSPILSVNGKLCTKGSSLHLFTKNGIPCRKAPENFLKAFKVLKYWETLGTSLLVTLLPAVIQTAVTAVIGYGLAKFEFPGKNFIFIFLPQK